MEQKKIKIGKFILGNHMVPVQTMIKNPIGDVELTLKKIDQLSGIGCDIIRVAVPDKNSIAALKEILRYSILPVVADIHFDYRLAIMAVESGVHKLRINPGNIGAEDRVKKIIDCLHEYQIPVRIGINCGSLPDHINKKHDNHLGAMIEAAHEELKIFEKNNYQNIVLSFKSSNVVESIHANRKASEIFPYPLHIGITEAGDSFDGLVKNSIGISSLLLDGIGSTLRVSLTDTEEKEVLAGIKILESIGKREANYEIISCPTCGRSGGEINKIVGEVKKIMNNIKLKKKLKIAVMGCMVNGPGEAKNADFGIACGKKNSLLFKDGKKLKVIAREDILIEIENLINEFKAGVF